MPVTLPFNPIRHYRLDAITGGSTATDFGSDGSSFYEATK